LAPAALHSSPSLHRTWQWQSIPALISNLQSGIGG
jgi:hypothetical protein